MVAARAVLRQTKTPGAPFRSKRGPVSRDGEALQRAAGLSRAGKKQCSIVETKFEVVGRHPTGDVCEGQWRRVPRPGCHRMEKRRKVVEVNRI